MPAGEGVRRLLTPFAGLSLSAGSMRQHADLLCSGKAVQVWIVFGLLYIYHIVLIAYWLLVVCYMLV